MRIVTHRVMLNSAVHAALRPIRLASCPHEVVQCAGLTRWIDDNFDLGDTL